MYRGTTDITTLAKTQQLNSEQCTEWD